MSYIKVYIHYVWSTKNREPLLTDKIRKKVFQHIRDNAQSKGIYIDFINGYTDHVHCLVSMNAKYGIDKLVQLLKGESSYWINKNGLVDGRFTWQDEYLAVGVEENLSVIRNYIATQEEHHKHVSFDDEYQLFLKRYKLCK